MSAHRNPFRTNELEANVGWRGLRAIGTRFAPSKAAVETDSLEQFDKRFGVQTDRGSTMSCEWLYRMDTWGETPLRRASRSGHMVLVDVMLLQEIEDARSTSMPEGSLQRAAFEGRAAMVRTLLRKGADPDVEDERWETPLHKAVRRGHLSVVEALLRGGADPNATNLLGMTPLHWAALTGNVEIAEVLVEAGAYTQIRSGHLDCLTPLELAKAMGDREFGEIVQRFAYIC